eukprot:CAMPEP_0114133144 /NCGR_PEP_ID=MMETSP0043_2-20121206/13469_1 /TAXON_ID=464988 /ORGANISM="Hemiselmis andersenii, Strain CCMP644" /LENGTH=73 /DNA_ID=CAMNT_0001226701 /DNA_START=41 /DNA_END=262 /DNA_ORIENTATION=-
MANLLSIRSSSHGSICTAYARATATPTPSRAAQALDPKKDASTWKLLTSLPTLSGIVLALSLAWSKSPILTLL